MPVHPTPQCHDLFSFPIDLLGLALLGREQVDGEELGKVHPAWDERHSIEKECKLLGICSMGRTTVSAMADVAQVREGKGKEGETGE